MTRLQFNELVERLAQRYEGRPRALAWATAGWLAFGYIALYAGLTAALAGGLAMIVVGVWLAHHAAVWLVAGGVVVLLLAIGLYGPLIWTRRDPGKELALKPEEARELQAQIEDLRLAVGCRPFHRIVISTDANAGVVTEPRFGLLGGSRQVLHLGLTLMEILSLDEFRAVLAHEFVHHSQSHGRFSVWVYRVRSSWEKVYAQLESGNQWKSLRWVQWFLRWYWPRMNARAFLLCREHEYAADRFSAEHVGSETAATSLFRSETIDRYLDLVFWPAMQRAPEKISTPPDDLMQRLLTCLWAAPPADCADWCAAATYARLTDTADTHPSWADRATAMGADPARFERHGFPRRPVPSAAQLLLGNDWSRLSQQVSSLWVDAVTESRNAQKRRMSGMRRRLEQIAPLVDARPSDVSLRWEQANLVKELEGPEAVAPLLQPLCNLNPPHRGAAFELGQLNLANGDPSGATLLEEIVQQQRDSFYEPACMALCSFFRLTGRYDDMREMEARLDGRDTWAEWIREGHRHLARGVACLPHDLSPEQLAPLVESLGRYGEVAAAWLVRVASRYPGAPPLFVLCVSTRPSLLGIGGSTAEQRLARRLIGQIPVPGRVLLIACRGPDRRLARRVRSVPDAQIFP